MSDLLMSAAGDSRAAFSWLLTANFSTLALLAAAVGLDLLTARRFSPGWRIALYVPVFLRVLVPPHVTWTVPFWKLAASAFASIVPGAGAVASCEVAAPKLSGLQTTPLQGLLFVLFYGVGLAVVLAHWIIAERRLRKIVAECRSEEGSSEILLSENVGPMVVGGAWGRPRIIIPVWLTSSEALLLILAHERAHIARRDPAFALALRLFCAIAWPVVPVWLAASRIRALMEQACDERALGDPASRTQETVMRYASTMIDIAQKARRLSGSLAFGAALPSRIKALRATRHWPAAVQCAASLALPVILFACSAARPAPPELSPGVLAADTRAPTQPQNQPPNQRTIFARVARGDMPMAEWDGATSNAVFIDRPKLIDRGNWWDTLNIDAAPTILVEVGQAAEVRSGDGTSSYTLDVTVHDSAPDTLNATISFTEGSSYRLPPTLLLWKKGQTCIIRVPSVVFAQPPRTLIIDVLLPGEDPGC